jgi:broad specificity phosphatase PhoE
MAELTLYLLRHGESLANVERVFAARKIDPPLSDTGIQQITMQAKSLRDLILNSRLEFSALYASPLLRAKHTAEIVSQWCGLKPLFSDDLMEVDVGVLDGEDQGDVVKWAMYENVMKKWEQGLHNVGFQGGESLNDIECRFRRFLEELENKRPEWERESRFSGSRKAGTPAEPRDETQNRIKRGSPREIIAIEHGCSKSYISRGENILVVGHCLLFMAVIWLFCENHGPTLEDGHMGRGHLSIIRNNPLAPFIKGDNNDRFRLLKFNIPPETSAKGISHKYSR